MAPGRAIALGDQPAGNDEGLTRMHPGRPRDDDSGAAAVASVAAPPSPVIPIVSVSERGDMVPPWLKNWHVTQHGGNAAASAALLSALADAEAAARATGGQGCHLDSDSVGALVRRVNDEAGD